MTPQDRSARATASNAGSLAAAALGLALALPLSHATAQEASTGPSFDPHELSDPALPQAPLAPTAPAVALPMHDDNLVLPWAWPSLTLHYRRATDESLREVCRAPCRGRLIEDRYQLAVAPPGHEPRLAGGAFQMVRPGDALVLSYDNRAGLRSAGWVLVSAALTQFAITALTFNLAVILIIGLPLLVALSAVGVPLIGLMNEARVEIRPIPEALVAP